MLQVKINIKKTVLGKVFLELYAQLENFRLTLKSAGKHEKGGGSAQQPKSTRERREWKRAEESGIERESAMQPPKCR